MNYKELSYSERSASAESLVSRPDSANYARVAAAIANAHCFAHPHAEGSAWGAALWPEPPRSLPQRPASAGRPSSTRRATSAVRPASAGRLGRSARPASAGRVRGEEAARRGAERPGSAGRRIVAASHGNSTRIAWAGRPEKYAETNELQHSEGGWEDMQWASSAHIQRHFSEIERLKQIIVDKEAEVVVLKRNEERMQDEPWERMRSLTDVLNRRRLEVSDLARQLHDVTTMLSQKNVELETLQNEKKISDRNADFLSKENSRLMKKAEEEVADSSNNVPHAAKSRAKSTESGETHGDLPGSEANEAQRSAQKTRLKGERAKRTEAEHPEDKALSEELNWLVSQPKSGTKSRSRSPILRNGPRRYLGDDTNCTAVPQQARAGSGYRKRGSNRSSPEISPLSPSSSIDSDELSSNSAAPMLKPSRKTSRSPTRDTAKQVGIAPSTEELEREKETVKEKEMDEQRRERTRDEEASARERLEEATEKIAMLTNELASGRVQAIVGALSETHEPSAAAVEIAHLRGEVRTLREENLGLRRQLAEAKRLALKSNQTSTAVAPSSAVVTAAVSTALPSAHGSTIPALGEEEEDFLECVDREDSEGESEHSGGREGGRTEEAAGAALAPAVQVQAGAPVEETSAPAVETAATAEGRIAALELDKESAGLEIEGLQVQLADCRRQLDAQSAELAKERRSNSNNKAIRTLKSELLESQRELEQVRSDPMSLFMDYNGIQEDGTRERSLSSKASEIEKERAKMYPSLGKTVEAFEGYVLQLQKELLEARFQISKWQKSKWEVDAHNDELKSQLEKTRADQAHEEGTEQRRLILVEALTRVREELAKSLMEAGTLLEEKDTEDSPEKAFQRFSTCAELILILQESKHEGQSLELGLALLHMGQIRLRQAQYLEAKKLFARALEIRQKKLGAVHPLTLDIVTLIKTCDDPPQNEPRERLHGGSLHGLSVVTQSFSRLSSGAVSRTPSRTPSMGRLTPHSPFIRPNSRAPSQTPSPLRTAGGLVGRESQGSSSSPLRTLSRPGGSETIVEWEMDIF